MSLVAEIMDSLYYNVRDTVSFTKWSNSISCLYDRCDPASYTTRIREGRMPPTHIRAYLSDTGSVSVWVGVAGSEVLN